MLFYFFFFLIVIFAVILILINEDNRLRNICLTLIVLSILFYFSVDQSLDIYREGGALESLQSFVYPVIGLSLLVFLYDDGRRK